QLSLRLNQLSRWFPRPIIWIVLGLIGLVWRRPRGTQTLLALGLAAMLVIVFNALGLFADPHFALPVAPAFVLLAAGALLGRRPVVDQCVEQDRPRVRNDAVPMLEQNRERFEIGEAWLLQCHAFAGARRREALSPVAVARMRPEKEREARSSAALFPPRDQAL